MPAPVQQQREERQPIERHEQDADGDEKRQ
jgi:hypothetical protein